MTLQNLQIPEQDRLRILELHKEYGINHIIFLLDYKYNADVVNQVLRDHITAQEVTIAQLLAKLELEKLYTILAPIKNPPHAE